MADDSDFLVFADESGDHGLASIDPQFPVFSLVFCVVRKTDYRDVIVPAFQTFKFDFWGHDCVVLHERDIRKSLGPFAFLRTDRERRERFMARMNDLVETAPMDLYASVIDKNRLKERYANPWNPYEVALLFCMERLLAKLIEEGQAGRRVHVLFESRGREEDSQLELEFRRIVENDRNWGYRSPDFRQMQFEPVFVDKKINSTGLQLADLTARPIALQTLNPTQPNRAFDIISGKLRQRKVFP